MANPHPEIIKIMATHDRYQLLKIIAELERQRDSLVNSIRHDAPRDLVEDLEAFGVPNFKAYFKSNDYVVPGRS